MEGLSEDMKPEEFDKIKEKGLEKYIDRIDGPSKDFRQFLYEYFTGSDMICGRVEEDTTVWERLKGEELETAKQMILDNLAYDTAYMRAIDVFRDERGIPLLENIAVTKTNRHYYYERLYAAKILYDWVGYEPYIEMLAAMLPKSSNYSKTSLDMWIHGLDENLAVHYILLMMRDEDSFVRWCAYGAFKRYFKLGDDLLDRPLSVKEQRKRYEENKYYTDDDVYADKELFEARFMELEARIASLRGSQIT